MPLVRDWVMRQPFPDNPFERVFGEGDLRLPWLALYVAEQRWNEANTLVRRAIVDAQTVRHRPAQIQFSVWQAIVAQGMGDIDTANAALCDAVHIGTPGRFVRAFFPADHDLRPLLRQIKPSLPDDEAAWVDHLILRGPGKPASIEMPNEGAKSSCLTPTEQRVLSFLQMGYSNQNIATKLFITERTVKKHVGNIMKKLDAPNRTAAVSRAVELHLL